MLQSQDRKVIKKEAEKILKYKELTIEIVHVECKNKDDTSNNRGDWGYFKVIKKACKQHTRKTGSQGTTENSHIGHCTHTSESTNVKVL